MDQSRQSTGPAARASSATRLDDLALLASGVGHDLANQLLAVQHAVGRTRERARSGAASDDALAAEFDAVEDAIDEISRTLVRLLSVNRAGAARTQSIDVIEFMQHLVDQRAAAADTPAAIEGPADPTPTRCTVSDAALEIAMTEVIDNAIAAAEAGPGEPWIGWSVDTAADRIEIRIANSGHPLAPEIEANAMRPMYAAETRPMAGLGLVIAERALHSIGADLAFEARADGGAVVTIGLSAADRSVAKPTDEPARPVWLLDEARTSRRAILDALVAAGVDTAVDGLPDAELASLDAAVGEPRVILIGRGPRGQASPAVFGALVERYPNAACFLLGERSVERAATTPPHRQLRRAPLDDVLRAVSDALGRN